MTTPPPRTRVLLAWGSASYIPRPYISQANVYTPSHAAGVFKIVHAPDTNPSHFSRVLWILNSCSVFPLFLDNIPARSRQVSFQRKGSDLDARTRHASRKCPTRQHADSYWSTGSSEGPREISSGDLHGRPAGGVQPKSTGGAAISQYIFSAHCSNCCILYHRCKTLFFADDSRHLSY